MTKEKMKSLTKYVSTIQDQLKAPLSAKHLKRGSDGRTLKIFLEGEIKRTKAALADAALTEDKK